MGEFYTVLSQGWPHLAAKFLNSGDQTSGLKVWVQLGLLVCWNLSQNFSLSFLLHIK